MQHEVIIYRTVLKKIDGVNRAKMCAASVAPKANDSCRLVDDYKPLNKVTKVIKSNFSDMCFLDLALVFYELDLVADYWQIPVKKKDINKTILSARSGLCQFLVVPVGLVNAPASVQLLMIKTLTALNWSCDRVVPMRV